MSNDFFKFKQFTILQNKCAMKVGTDGVLLGAWANTTNAESILDIGAGSGLITIMLAQRSNANIFGVEIDTDAAIQATNNALNSPWSNRLEIINSSIQNYVDTTHKKFDLIVSNPPFFNNSLKSPVIKRSTARHTDTLSQLDILNCATSLLNKKGLITVILPYAEGCLFIVEAAKKGFFCIRKTNIKPIPYSSTKRLLMEFSSTPSPCFEDIIIIGTGHGQDYSDKYKLLTKDFYLLF
jgi:tRNA1Val (adenine37-N6)-methyltransferase